jgi:hypothetical protein
MPGIPYRSLEKRDNSKVRCAESGPRVFLLLSTAGIAILIGIAGAVLLFGELQWVGLRQPQKTLSTA